MIVRQRFTRVAILASGFAVGGAAHAADAARTGGPAQASDTGIQTVGYSTGSDACVAGNCRSGGAVAHGYRCGCPECSSPSAYEKLCQAFKMRKREALHDHSTWAIDHYRHLHHPKCPPYCHPSWGYYQTCWSRFPEETLWCPECPPGVGTALPLPAPVVTPIGPAVSPPPAPTRVSPAPAPLPEPRSVEEPPSYEDTPADENSAEEASAGTASVFVTDEVVSVGYAAEMAPSRVTLATPPFLSPPRAESRHPVEPPPHPRNRWRMEQ